MIVSSRALFDELPVERACALLAAYTLGKEELLPKLLRCLQSRNYRVWCAISNNIDLIVKPSNHPVVARAFTTALERETTVAAREALSHAVECIQRMAA